jgi:hypothetical protein
MINIDDRLLPMINEDELWLLLHIAKRMGKTLSCFPSMDKLIEDTQWSKNTVKKHRKALIEKEIITMRDRWVGEGKRTSNNYQINTPFVGVHVTLQQIEHAQKRGGQNLTPQPSKVSNFDTLGGSKFGGEGGSNFGPLSINHYKQPHTLKEGEVDDLTFDKSKNQNSITNIQNAKNLLLEYYQQNPGAKKYIISETMFLENENQTFEKELKKYVEYNSHNPAFLSEPTKYLSNLFGWFRNAKNFNRNNKNHKNQKNGKSTIATNTSKELVDDAARWEVLRKLEAEGL